MKMYCKNCGNSIDNDTKFCPHCGAPVNRQASLESDSQTEKKPILIMLLSVACLCMLAVIIFLLVTGKKEGNSSEAPSEQTASVTEAGNEETAEPATGAAEPATGAAEPATGAAEPASEEAGSATEGTEPAPEAAEPAEETPDPVEGSSEQTPVYETLTANTAVGDIVAFGSYEKDNVPENGMEALEWRVLEKSGDYYLLITEEAIDSIPYNDEWTETTWEICSLREWLNSDFLNKAFSKEQRDRIISGYDPHGFRDTIDKAAILGTEELEYYFDSDDERQTKPTAYAEARGAFTHTNGCTWYWIREAGNDPHYAMYVNCLGDILHNGTLVFGNSFGIRPVIWVLPQ